MIHTIVSGDKGYKFTDELTVDGVPLNPEGKTFKFVLRAGAVEWEWPATHYLLPPSGVEVEFAVVPGLNPPFPTVPGDYEQRWRSLEGETFRLSHPNDQVNTVRIIT